MENESVALERCVSRPNADVGRDRYESHAEHDVTAFRVSLRLAEHRVLRQA